MPRRKTQRSASDSDSSDDERTLDLQLYKSLQLEAALRRPTDFATAASELAALLRHCYSSGRCAKQVQAAMVEDVYVAIQCCDSRLQCCASLAALMEAAERHLPQAKRNTLLRQYRRSSVQLRRRERRHGGSGGASDGDEEGEGAVPASFEALPVDVVEQVLRYLDPVTLGRAACVCREWAAAARDDTLWQRHCSSLAAAGPRRGLAATARAGGAQPRPNGAPQQQQQEARQAQQAQQAGDASGMASYRRRFAVLAAQHPERLLPWSTNRVLVGGQLAWLAPGQQLPPRCRHISTAAVLAYCRRGARPHASADSSSSGSEGEQDGVTRGLRFWHL